MIQLSQPNVRRIFFVATLFLCLVVILVMVAHFFRPKKEISINKTVSTAEQSVMNKRSERVFIKDFYTYQDSIDPQTQRWIEHLIYTFPNQSRPDLYTGIIRPGSYSNKAATGSLMNIEFLIDIEPSDVTYKVAFSARKNTDFQSVAVTCASREQQINKSTTCQDGGGRE